MKTTNTGATVTGTFAAGDPALVTYEVRCAGLACGPGMSLHPFALEPEARRFAHEMAGSLGEGRVWLLRVESLPLALHIAGDAR